MQPVWNHTRRRSVNVVAALVTHATNGHSLHAVHKFAFLSTKAIWSSPTNRLRRFSLSAGLMFVLVTVALAEQEKSRKQSEPSQQAYLLTCPKRGSNIEIKVVDRSEIDKGIYVDITGLRLYADSPESRRNAYERMVGRISNHFYAQHFITDTLSKLRSQTGIEPEFIPVKGEEGKKRSVEGMVLIKGGEFVRPGKYFISNYVTEPVEAKGDKYRVQMSPFYIDKYKVTNQQYCDFLNDGNQGYWTPWNPRIVKSRRGKYVPADPLLADIHVVSVHWFQAVGYAEWAGKRLPTEAEWEFAAAGPEGRKYPWGNEEPDKTRANFRSKRHTPGDAFPAGATPDGVFDLAGNSAEWIADFYDEDYYRKAPPAGVLKDPQGPEHGSAYKKYRRMFKGICKGFESPNMLCVFKRHSRPPLLPAGAGIGFRCVQDATPKDESSESVNAENR